jgi:hypothetical protein
MMSGAPESPDLYLSDEPKNAENGAELINIQSNYCCISFCIIDQKPQDN